MTSSQHSDGDHLEQDLPGKGIMIEVQQGPVIEEFSGHRHASVEGAHEAVMPVLAQLVATAIQAGLDSGRYFVENGTIKLSREEETHEELSAGERRPRVGILP